MVLEKYLIEHCAPTLASLKTASLMSLPWGEEMEHQILRYNEELSGKGVEILVFKARGKSRASLCISKEDAGRGSKTKQSTPNTVSIWV